LDLAFIGWAKKAKNPTPKREATEKYLHMYSKPTKTKEEI
jgi:hypothetical protein